MEDARRSAQVRARRGFLGVGPAPARRTANPVVLAADATPTKAPPSPRKRVSRPRGRFTREHGKHLRRRRRAPARVRLRVLARRDGGTRGPWLAVEVHRELVGVRADLDAVGLFAPELDVGGDQVVGEDASAGEEGVVGLERVERLVERCRDGGDVRELLRRELVEVAVDRLAGVQLPLDPVQPGHQHRREGEVGIGERVGRTELHSFGLRRGGVHRDAYGGRAVALGVLEQDGRLVARDQPAVGVRRGRAERHQRRRVLQQPGRVVEGQRGQQPVAVR